MKFLGIYGSVKKFSDIFEIFVGKFIIYMFNYINIFFIVIIF